MLGKKNRLLGIDISPTAVKLVELNLDAGRPQVEAMAVESLPEGVVEDRNLTTDVDTIAAAVRRACRSSGTRLKRAAVAVPTSSVVTRTITLPVEYGEEEIEAAIEVEATQYIPYPLEEVYLDFEVRGGSKATRDSKDVMLVATRREYVDVREEILEEAGLEAAVVDVEAYALENVFAELSRHLYFADTDGKDVSERLGRLRTAVMDVGSIATTLYVFQGAEVVFNREQAIGCDQLTQAIAEAYDLPKNRAEMAKRAGELPDDYADRVLKPFRYSIAEQVANALQFFYSSSNHNSVDGMMLMGGGGLVPELSKAIAERVGAPVIVANPFEAMGYAKRVNPSRLLREAPMFNVACGLALRGLQ